MTKKIIKITAISLACVIGALVLAVVVYVVYVSAQYYRIEDKQALNVENPREDVLLESGTYTISTYNIGFGAYDHNFSFFMDSGRMKSGEKLQGKGSKAKNKQTVLNNTDGALDAVAKLDPDFLFFQEVDTDSTRSRGVNQYEMIKEKFKTDYSYSFAVNFHSAFLFYPIFDPHGEVNAGLATASRYKTTESVRYSFPIDNGFPAKFFDLDRCFSVTRVPVDNGRELVLIHQHMSAYDKGGAIRAQQLKLLNTVMAAEREAGNYVIVGGDFNHILTEKAELFPSEQSVPDWVHQLAREDIAEGFVIACGENAPTCRSTDMPYTAGVNYTAVLDGFLVSDNIRFTVTNIDVDFAYSDHNPVLMNFAFM